MDPEIRYASPGTAQPGTGRSPATWAKLLAVWAAGLITWTLYLVALGFLLMTILT